MTARAGDASKLYSGCGRVRARAIGAASIQSSWPISTPMIAASAVRLKKVAKPRTPNAIPRARADDAGASNSEDSSKAGKTTKSKIENEQAQG